MDYLREQIFSIAKGHADIMRSGLKHGGQIELGKVVDFINAQLDSRGLANDFNVGYRTAMGEVRGEILSLLRSLK